MPGFFVFGGGALLMTHLTHRVIPDHVRDDIGVGAAVEQQEVQSPRVKP